MFLLNSQTVRSHLVLRAQHGGTVALLGIYTQFFGTVSYLGLFGSDMFPSSCWGYLRYINIIYIYIQILYIYYKWEWYLLPNHLRLSMNGWGLKFHGPDSDRFPPNMNQWPNETIGKGCKMQRGILQDLQIWFVDVEISESKQLVVVNIVVKLITLTPRSQ